MYGSLPDGDFYFNLGRGGGAAEAASKPKSNSTVSSDAPQAGAKRENDDEARRKQIAALPDSSVTALTPRPNPSMPVLLDLDISTAGMAY